MSKFNGFNGFGQWAKEHSHCKSTWKHRLTYQSYMHVTFSLSEEAALAVRLSKAAKTGGIFFAQSNVSFVMYTRTIHSLLHHKVKRYACLVWSSASLWGWAFCLSGLYQLKFLWSKLRNVFFILFIFCAFILNSWSQLWHRQWETL